MAKPFRKYKGVRIFKNKDLVVGSDFRVTEAGRLVPAKPQYTISYGWPDSYPYDTLEEAKEAVDNVLAKAVRLGIDVRDMVAVMNEL